MPYRGGGIGSDRITFSLHGRRLDLNQRIGMEQRRDAKEGASRLDACGLQSPAECLRGAEECRNVRRVVVEPDNVPEGQPGVAKDDFEVVERLPDLCGHVTRVQHVPLVVDRCLPRAVQDTVTVSHVDRLREAVLVLPRPWIDPFPFAHAHLRADTVMPERFQVTRAVRRSRANGHNPFRTPLLPRIHEDVPFHDHVFCFKEMRAASFMARTCSRSLSDNLSALEFLSSLNNLSHVSIKASRAARRAAPDARAARAS